MKIGFVLAVATVAGALSTTTVTTESIEARRRFPIRGSFLHFYRDLSPELWAKELDGMRELDMDTIVIVAAGRLRTDTADLLGYSLAADHLIYPSGWVAASERPVTDRLELILTLADQRRMSVYVGSLQTESDWSTGREFTALREYNRRVAAEVVKVYGHHSSLRGWYFTQEIWMDRVKQKGPGYYGTALLRDFVTDMKALDAGRRTMASVVLKTADLAPEELESTLIGFLQATRVDTLMPQDGVGAGAGAPVVEQLPAYFKAMAAACEAAGTGTALWATTETFTAAPELSNDRYPPANIGRIAEQVEAVRPFVSGYVSWIYGNDMSPQATYYPVEASVLRRAYRTRYKPDLFRAHQVLPIASYVTDPAAAAEYPDNVALPKLMDRKGGGYNGSSLDEWIGFRAEDTGGAVQITADLGDAKPVSSVRVLTQSWTDSGIYRPRRMTAEISADGAAWKLFGSTEDFPADTPSFAVMWGESTGNAHARFVRITFAHTGYLFLSELEVLGASQ